MDDLWYLARPLPLVCSMVFVFAIAYCLEWCFGLLPGGLAPVASVGVTP
jgi:hypothetical protein